MVFVCDVGVVDGGVLGVSTILCSCGCCHTCLCAGGSNCVCVSMSVGVSIA